MSDQVGYDRTWFTYRLLDASGKLLYAGSATNVRRRLREHAGHSWMAEVACVEVQEFGCRWRAALAERHAGRGRHGGLRGGIGKALAAVMTDEDLAEAMTHPTYAMVCDATIAIRWGLGINKVRELRDRVADGEMEVPVIPATSIAKLTLFAAMGKPRRPPRRMKRAEPADGMTEEEAAEAIGISRLTVRSALGKPHRKKA